MLSDTGTGTGTGSDRIGQLLLEDEGKGRPLLPNLEGLIVSGIPAIGQQWILDGIAANAPSLVHLGIGHMNVPADALAAFLQRIGEKLLSLDMAWAPAVATRTMRDIAVVCPRL